MPMMRLSGLGAALGNAALPPPSCRALPCRERWMLWRGLEPLVARRTREPSSDGQPPGKPNRGVLCGLGKWLFYRRLTDNLRPSWRDGCDKGPCHEPWMLWGGVESLAASLLPREQAAALREFDKWLFCRHLAMSLRPAQRDGCKNRPCHEPWMLWGGAESLVASLVPKAGGAALAGLGKWLFCRRLAMSLRPALFPGIWRGRVRGDAITAGQMSSLAVPWGGAIPAAVDGLRDGWAWEWDVDAGELTVTDAEGHATTRHARTWSELGVSVDVLQSGQFSYIAAALGDPDNRPCHEPWMLWNGVEPLVAALVPKAQFAVVHELGSLLFWRNPAAGLFPEWWFPCDNRPCYERWMLWGDLYKYTWRPGRRKYGWEIFNLSPNWGDWG